MFTQLLSYEVDHCTNHRIFASIGIGETHSGRIHDVFVDFKSVVMRQKDQHNCNSSSCLISLVPEKCSPALGVCLWFGQGKKNQTDASRQCADTGGTLAILDLPGLFFFAVSLVMKENMYGNFCAHSVANVAKLSVCKAV